MVLAVVLSIVVGVSLGLLGGGGSILTVPILVYAAGIDAKQAVAMSLAVVGTTSLAALVSHARAGRVRWKTGAVFGAASMAGAYFGGWLARFFSGSTLLMAFALMMITTAIAMWRGPKRQPSESKKLRLVPAVLEGLAVGAVTGLVGAGGGFLVVPALVLLGGLPASVAVGTSLLVLTLKSYAGLAGHLSHVSLDWTLTAAVTAAAIVGSLLGVWLTRYVGDKALRKGFAGFVAAAGLLTLALQAGG